MASIIKVDQIQSDSGTVNVSSNLQFSSGFTLANPTIVTPTISGVMTLGAGIKFPAIQVSSDDANTLDDYEEGSWTPTIFGSSTAGTQTQPNPSYQITPTGVYTKIGRYVELQAQFAGVSLSGGAGNLMMGGLPFNFTAVRGIITYLEGVNWAFSSTPTGTYSPGGVILTGSGTSCYFRPAFNQAWDVMVSASSTTFSGGGNGMHGSINLFGYI